MTISITAVLVFVAKFLITVLLGLFEFIFVCYPIGDKDTSKTQWTIFAIILAITIFLVFGGYHYIKVIA